MGERFIETVESTAGPDVLAQVWKGPDWLPNLAEIRQPQQWIDRVRTATVP